MMIFKQKNNNVLNIAIYELNLEHLYNESYIIIFYEVYYIENLLFDDNNR